MFPNLVLLGMRGKQKRHRGPRASTDVKIGGKLHLGTGPGPWVDKVQKQCVGLVIT